MSNRATTDPVLTVRRDGYMRYSLVWFTPATGNVVLACDQSFTRARDATTYGLKAGFGCAIRVSLPTMKG
jgi:hypothetical protein